MIIANSNSMMQSYGLF